MKYRSVLFVPGHEERKIKKAYTLNSDLIVIDLESTVPKDQKEHAKKIIKEAKKAGYSSCKQFKDYNGLLRISVLGL